MRFGTYAQQVVTGAMQRQLQHQLCAEAGDVPRAVHEAAAAATRAAARLAPAADSWEEWPTEAVAAAAGLRPERVRHCLRTMQRRPGSADALCLGQSTAAPAVDSLPSFLQRAACGSSGIDAEIDWHWASAEVSAAVLRLADDERRALCAYFGLADPGSDPAAAAHAGPGDGGESTAASSSGSSGDSSDDRSSDSSGSKSGNRDASGKGSGMCSGSGWAPGSGKPASLSHKGSYRAVSRAMGMSEYYVKRLCVAAMAKLRGDVGLAGLLHELLPEQQQ